MKAVCWNGITRVSVEDVPDPQILNPRDAIIQVTSTAICGSDLHLYDGYVPAMKPGDILGHEFMGTVVETGEQVPNLNVGDRVVVPFPIACGRCYFCERGLWALCDNSNPKASLAEGMYGHSPAGIYGYSHLLGGYAGGQAEYVRVPFADIGPFKIENGFRDEQVLFLTDIFPTGYMAAEQANIQPGDTVAIWGCGPVGQFAIQSAWMFNAARVIAIDRFPERLEMAQTYGRAEIIDYSRGVDVVETLKQMTGGMGPDVCIDAVGMEAHKTGLEGVYDFAKQTVKIESDRPYVLREVIQACRKGGTVSLAGVYGGFVDTIPMGAAFNKGLTLKMGQTHVHRYFKPLFEKIESGQIDPSFVVTHILPLQQAPEAYEIFKKKIDGCIKVVLKPD
ncbi:MAG TPA: zinc-dependent alcohol dehydrogenase [Anaerolineales bacterium]|nr:zinc-dependent alcohol dehydrogenase [Anaerolineales bacterium]